MIEDVKPTRSELLKLKKKIKLAENGHKLLKKKRDGLIMELRKIIKEVGSLRKEIIQDIIEGEKYLREVEIYEGYHSIKSASLFLKDVPQIEIIVKNLMGVKVPKIEKRIIKKGEEERAKIMLTLTPNMINAIKKYEDSIEKIITTAEIEITLRNLLMEIEKTKRRVNALEYIVIPKLKAQMQWIKLMLDEAERQNTFRLKIIKKKNEGKG